MLRQYGIVFILIGMLLLSACTIKVQDKESASVSSNTDIFEKSEDDLPAQLQTDVKILTRDEAGKLLFNVLGINLDWNVTFPHCSEVRIIKGRVYYIITPIYYVSEETTKMGEYAVEIHGLEIYDTIIPSEQSEWTLVYESDNARN